MITNEEGECDGHLLLSGGTLGLTDSVVCPNQEPNGFINHHITFIPLDREGRPIVSPSISMSIFEITGEDNSPIISNDQLGSRGALTAQVLRGQASDITLQSGGIYRLRIVDQDDDIDVASVLQLSQLPNLSYQEELLTLEEDEMNIVVGTTLQTTLFIVPEQQ